MDTVEIRADGSRHLVRGPSKVDKIAKVAREEARKVFAERQIAKAQKVAHKRAMQRRKGWPSGKSPI